MNTISTDIIALAYRKCMAAARSEGAPGLNAEMIAQDAVSAAWIDRCKFNDEGHFLNAAKQLAKYAARAERVNGIRVRSFEETVGFDDLKLGDMLGEPETQTSKYDFREMTRVYADLPEDERALFAGLMSGKNAIDLSKEIGRSVPLIVADIERMRKTLATLNV